MEMDNGSKMDYNGGDVGSIKVSCCVCSQLYAWMYDPVPAKTFIIGLLLGQFEKHKGY